VLVLTRKEGETIVLSVGAMQIVVTIADVKGFKVRVGIEAPDEVKIWRGELLRHGEPVPTHDR
jgi:carbon storage regulator